MNHTHSGIARDVFERYQLLLEQHDNQHLKDIPLPILTRQEIIDKMRVLISTHQMDEPVEYLLLDGMVFDFQKTSEVVVLPMREIHA